MILLLGASGYIGSAFCTALERSTLDYLPISRSQVDYYDKDDLVALIRQSRPVFLVNAAGYSGRPNVDACEHHKAECLLANAVLPGIVRDACEDCGLPWGHVSSGCIYTGARPDGCGFTEEDPPNFTFRQNNCSFYSGTKALGEEVLAGADCCYIWRLRIPFSHVDSRRNYISKLLRYERLLDARNSLSHLDHFVEACLHSVMNEVPYGIYNLTNTGSITTREVVEKIRQSRLASREFRFFHSEAEFMQVAAETPRSNCVLDNSKAREAGIHLCSVQEALDQALHAWTGCD